MRSHARNSRARASPLVSGSRNQRRKNPLLSSERGYIPVPKHFKRCSMLKFWPQRTKRKREVVSCGPEYLGNCVLFIFSSPPCFLRGGGNCVLACGGSCGEDYDPWCCDKSRWAATNDACCYQGNICLACRMKCPDRDCENWDHCKSWKMCEDAGYSWVGPPKESTLNDLRCNQIW